jgi:glycosyltransferase involved in cell wall biosynthesis
MTESLLVSDSELLSDEDFFIKPQKKYKVLMLSDHPLAPSGVGVQARFLIDGLIATGQWSFRCLGGAIKHANYDTVAVNPDFIVKPVDGFGNREMIRSILLTERPDALFLFTDPRQFIWVWEMEDEIRQICPIVYWHVWDNDPYPKYNHPWYEGTDLINCLSYKTYELVKEHFPSKTNYIPHAFPKNIYFPMPEEQVAQLRKQNFGPRADWFQVLWVNRNATRKMPADLLLGWKTFLENLEKKHGHKNATLIMHTDPGDPEGPNLLVVCEELGLREHVWFSAEKLQFEQMNLLHNITDTCINISKNEGFGLSTLISMMTGKPIVALCTGGMTRQVIDYRDGTENGVAIKPIKRSLVGSQLVPYIYEDFCTEHQISDALMKIYEMTPEQKKEMKAKVLEYCDAEFSYEKMVSEWHRTMLKTVEDFKKAKNENKQRRFTLTKIEPIQLNTVRVNTEKVNVEPNQVQQLPPQTEAAATVTTELLKQTQEKLKVKKLERKKA